LPPHLHLGKYYRYLWEDTSLFVILGYFPEVAVSKKLYEERYGIKPVQKEAESSLHALMGACALAAVSLADRETWGCTMTLPGSDFGFFCAVEPEGVITATVRPTPPDRAAAYVQRQKGTAPMTQSLLEPKSADPVKVVEQYFNQAVQTETRIVLDADASGVLVQALPGGNFAAVSTLEEDLLLDLCRQSASRGDFKPMGEVLIFYECRCDDQIILNMITALPETERRAIWGDLPSLSIECPRCGREYTVERTLQ
jgi:hypothetical protein